MAIPCTSAIHVEKRFQKYSRAGARVKLIPGGGGDVPADGSGRARRGAHIDAIPGKNVQVPRELEPFDRFAPCTQRNTAPFVEGASHMPRPPQKVN